MCVCLGGGGPMGWTLDLSRAGMTFQAGQPLWGQVSAGPAGAHFRPCKCFISFAYCLFVLSVEKISPTPSFQWASRNSPFLMTH